MTIESEILNWYHRKGYNAAAAEFLSIWAKRDYRFHDWDVDAIARAIRLRDGKRS